MLWHGSIAMHSFYPVLPILYYSKGSMTSALWAQKWTANILPIQLKHEALRTSSMLYRQLISRAHARGIKVIGATITPCEGVDIPGYYSDAKELVRKTVNKWIRTGGAFDGMIDFDAVVRDPDHPTRLLPKFASKDHLHPNDAGYKAMADSIDLALFGRFD